MIIFTILSSRTGCFFMLYRRHPDWHGEQEGKAGGGGDPSPWPHPETRVQISPGSVTGNAVLGTDVFLKEEI